MKEREDKVAIPTGHPFQRLYTRIHISLALMQPHPRMLNSLPLLIEISQGVSTNIFRFQCHALAFLQPGRATFQPLRAGQKLLSLLQVSVLPARFVVRVAVPEERLPIIGERFQLALDFIDVAAVVAEADVDF